MRDQHRPSIPNNGQIDSLTDYPSGATSSAWLTAAEAAQFLKVKTRTILLWARSGKIKGYTLSGTKRRVWCFLQRDLDGILIHSGPVVSSAQPSVLANERRV